MNNNLVWLLSKYIIILTFFSIAIGQDVLCSSLTTEASCLGNTCNCDWCPTTSKCVDPFGNMEPCPGGWKKGSDTFACGQTRTMLYILFTIFGVLIIGLAFAGVIFLCYRKIRRNTYTSI